MCVFGKACVGPLFNIYIVFIYIYIYVCVCVCVCVCVFGKAYVDTLFNIYIVYIYIYMCVCVCVCVCEKTCVGLTLSAQRSAIMPAVKLNTVIVRLTSFPPTSICPLRHFSKFSENHFALKFERKAPKRCTFFPDNPNTIFSEKKRIQAKTFIQRRKSHYVELLSEMIMARVAFVCPLTFWYQLLIQ